MCIYIYLYFKLKSNIMKNTTLIFVLALAISFLSFKPLKHNYKNLTINNNISSVEWIGEKVAGKHNGEITIKEGVINLHDGTPTTGKVVINMETISCSDLKGEWNQKLVSHLKSPDFFNVKNHKTSTLKINSFKLIKENKYTVKGDLTIKGISKPITFPATIEIKNDKLVAYAEFKIDRTLYDIKYNSGKFFESLGDKMINDEFIIKFKIAAS